MKELNMIKNSRTPSYRVGAEFLFSKETSSFLRKKAYESGQDVARFVLHKSNDSKVQEMIILKSRGYQEKWIINDLVDSKSFTVLSGCIFLEFKESGKRIELQVGDCFKFHPNVWHRIQYESEVIYKEVMDGPFLSKKTKYL